jgi:hypothetical protein
MAGEWNDEGGMSNGWERLFLGRRVFIGGIFSGLAGKVETKCGKSLCRGGGFCCNRGSMHVVLDSHGSRTALLETVVVGTQWIEGWMAKDNGRSIPHAALQGGPSLRPSPLGALRTIQCLRRAKSDGFGRVRNAFLNQGSDWIGILTNRMGWWWLETIGNGYDFHVYRCIGSYSRWKRHKIRCFRAGIRCLLPSVRWFLACGHCFPRCGRWEAPCSRFFHLCGHIRQGESRSRGRESDSMLKKSGCRG